MHKTDLVAAVAEKAKVSNEQANEVVTIIIDEISNALSRKESVSLIGFGSFVLRHRAVRTGRSPQTGESIQIPACNTVGFRPGKALKDRVKR